MHAGKAVQSCARPLQDRALSASDHQETQPMNLSPVAKGWRDDPPKEYPPSSDGRTFAVIMGRDGDVPPTAVLASPPKNPQTSEVKESKEPAVAGVQHGEQVKKGMEETGEKDLFHSTVVTTRLDQMQTKKWRTAKRRRMKTPRSKEKAEAGQEQREKEKQKEKQRPSLLQKSQRVCPRPGQSPRPGRASEVHLR